MWISKYRENVTPIYRGVTNREGRDKRNIVKISSRRKKNPAVERFKNKRIFDGKTRNRNSWTGMDRLSRSLLYGFGIDNSQVSRTTAAPVCWDTYRVWTATALKDVRTRRSSAGRVYAPHLKRPCSSAASCRDDDDDDDDDHRAKRYRILLKFVKQLNESKRKKQSNVKENINSVIIVISYYYCFWKESHVRAVWRRRRRAEKIRTLPVRPTSAVGAQSAE